MEFQSKDVERITGVKNKRLWAWIERGFLSPSIQEADGPGTRNIWSRNDLYTIAVFKNLTESGFAKKLVGDFMKTGVIPSDMDMGRARYAFYIRTGDEIKSSVVAADDGTINIPHLIHELGADGYDSIFIINLDKIKREIDFKI
jgi:hypothetical protein